MKKIMLFVLLGFTSAFNLPGPSWPQKLNFIIELKEPHDDGRIIGIDSIFIRGELGSLNFHYEIHYFSRPFDADERCIKFECYFIGSDGVNQKIATGPRLTKSSIEQTGVWQGDVTLNDPHLMDFYLLIRCWDAKQYDPLFGEWNRIYSNTNARDHEDPFKEVSSNSLLISKMQLR